MPVSVRVAPVVLSDDLETTAYYVAAEGIANATKHARARRITLDVGVRRQQVYVRVGDDGVGGAVPREGSGLAGLADRVAAHGGTLTITSPSAGGTAIEAVLPCA
ncbi:MAG TPA: ATP-binding protein [Kribbellaceae bacterium]|nr:ATP-binding protein [Kribbellaceae bacterium]